MDPKSEAAWPQLGPDPGPRLLQNWDQYLAQAVGPTLPSFGPETGP